MHVYTCIEKLGKRYKNKGDYYAFTFIHYELFTRRVVYVCIIRKKNPQKTW